MGVFFALIFIALVLYWIKTGQVRLRGGIRVRRDTYPLAFWLLVAGFLGVALFLVAMALRGAG